MFTPRALVLCLFTVNSFSPISYRTIPSKRIRSNKAYFPSNKPPQAQLSQTTKQPSKQHQSCLQLGKSITHLPSQRKVLQVPLDKPPPRPITPPRVRKHPKPHFFPPHMRDHFPQSTPRTGPISTKLNFGSLVVRSRVTKSTAVPRVKAAPLSIRPLRSAPRAVDPSKSLPNGTNTSQISSPQNDTMTINSSSNPATQAQDTTTNAATTDVAMTDTAENQSEQSTAEPHLYQRRDDGRRFDFYY